MLGIALGLAVVLSIDLANESARRSFGLFTQGIAGRATHQVVGGPGGVPETLYRTLRVDLGARAAAPVVEREVAALDLPGVTFHLMGVDPLAEAPFRSFLGEAPAPEAALATLMTRPGAALVARDTARRLGLAAGDSVAIRVGGVRRRLTVVGEMVPRDALGARALDTMLVTDIATAQEVLGERGRLSRIDLIIGDDAGGRAMLGRVTAALPPGAQLVPAGARSAAVEQMMRAFRINLTALSLLALVVGMFLIYNAMTFSVVQRRELFGMLRAVGVTRGQLLGIVGAEALAVGLVATAIGIPLGVVLGQGLVRLVARTINDLYVTLTVRDLAVPALSLLKAAALGLGGTLAAALPAALEATGTVPRAVLSRSTIETRSRRAAPRLALAGLALMAAGGALLVPPRWPVAVAYGAMFAILLGTALLVPLVTVALMRALRAPMGWAFGLLGRMAAGSVVGALSRTSVALAALMIAIATALGVGIMIHSFRQTVVRWLEASLQSDVYVSPPSLLSNRPDATLDPALVARLAAVPSAARMSTNRTVRVESALGSIQLVVVDLGGRGLGALAFTRGDPGAIGAQLERGGAVIVSEPFAYHHGLGAGSRLRLRTDRGEREFMVAGVYRDYGSTEGIVMMSRQTYEPLWDDRALSALGFQAAPGVDPDDLVAALRRAAGSGQEVVIRSNRALREASLQVFDRTFAVTVVLRLLATLVAFVGVLSALTALGLERARELAVLRAQGLTPRQVWGLVTAQSGLMGLVAGVLAVPVGITLSLILIFVINQRSFGWTLQLDLPPGILVQGVTLSVVAAVLAGAYPARRLARLPVAAALRDE